jgi:SAM-dependent MidA family methyltransferase
LLSAAELVVIATIRHLIRRTCSLRFPSLHHNAVLPPLSATEQAHHQKLLAHVLDQIRRAGGWLDFAEFMSLALYAPGLGYYSAGAHKLGAGGDFTTAPEISSLFSRCVALQVAQVLRETNGDVLELGAGTGVMAADMLLELEQQRCLPERYLILEVSADLRARQQQLLSARVPHLVERVGWPDALPDSCVGVVLANEVLDALPVSRFVMQGGAPQALGVSAHDAALMWQTRPASVALTDAVRAIEQGRGAPLPENYCSEINLQLPAWIKSVADALTRGVMLFIDYGHAQAQYYSDERSNGTLGCFFKQRLHDNPLINLGVQDITAWVDFTRVAEAGMAAGLELRGFATQAHFLFGCGLQHLLHDLSEQSDAARWRISQQVQKLTLPSEMGENFKAMAFAKDCDVDLSGFSFRDLRDRL